MIRINLLSKLCTCCKKEKPAREFVSEFLDALANRCSLCRSRGQRSHQKYTRENISAKRRYEAEYRQKRVAQPTDPEYKVCVRCTKTLALKEFSLSREGSLFRQCDGCRKYSREYLVNSRKKWTPDVAEHASNKARERSQAKRLTVISHMAENAHAAAKTELSFLH